MRQVVTIKGSVYRDVACGGMTLAPLPCGAHRVPFRTGNHKSPGEVMAETIRRIAAFNSATASENKMHDDTVARTYGFAGGLVTGVDIFAYMTHMPVARWGRAFLDHGAIDARFLKPVYDGEEIVIVAEEGDGGLALRVESRGEVCATGQASLPPAAPLIDAHGYQATQPVAARAPVTAASYPVGAWLGAAPQVWREDSATVYLGEVREDDPVYGAGGLCHPGMLQRLMNQVLIENAILGPWIHVGSRMQLLAEAHLGDVLTARAKVIDNYERKGHHFVELDALIVAGGDVPVAKCWHIAIWRPRAQAAA
jgi:acyl dehydratase